MANYTWGDTGAPMPPLDFVCEDLSWKDLLPPGSEITSNTGHVSSYWSQTGKIEVRLADGTLKRYFIKLTETPVGRLMVEGEFESMKALYMVVPEMVPKPYGWGTFMRDPNLHWFMCEYLDIQSEEQPPKEDFCRRLADMHKQSQAMAPRPGQYGFHVKTLNGTVTQLNEWRGSWEEYYSDKLRCALEQEIAVAGTSPEYEALWMPLFEKVVPRLLRPLETGGNTIVQTLVHGDLWYGNTAVRAVRSEPPVIIDAAAMWAHNEYDLHCWRGENYIFNREWQDEYFKHYPAAEPQEDVKHRSMLYQLNSALHCSILFKAPRWRMLVVQAVQDLTARFPDGYNGAHKRKGDEEEHHHGGSEECKGAEYGDVKRSANPGSCEDSKV